MSMDTTRRDRKRIAEQLREPAVDARALAGKLGLEPVEVSYWIVTHGEMNELIAYDGFQTRYPHWRWGMKYERQEKKSRHGLGKAFEIVINDEPAHAYLQESNSRADQKAVITHVEAHADFFANNRWYGLFRDGADAAAALENHARRIESYMTDPDIGREAVEEWIDHVLTVEDTIDQHGAFEAAAGRDDADDAGSPDASPVAELDLSPEVEREVFDEEWLEAYRADDDDPDPSTDVLAFLRRHGMAYDEAEGRAVEMAEWQRDVLDMLRAEAYYFAPQKMTKVMNEGWACVAPNTRVFTSEGLIEMSNVVGDQTPVSDGSTKRDVYDSNVVPDHDTVTIRTRRGLELTGSNDHRIRRPDGTWVRLDELDVGEEIEISGGNDMWPSGPVRVDWDNPEHVTLEDVAEEAGVSTSTVLRYREVGGAQRGDAIETALSGYEGERQELAQRERIRVPETVTEQLARFLGLLVGDGHISQDSRHVGFTTGHEEHAEEFAGLLSDLFGIDPTVSKQGSRWRVYAYSENLRELLTEEFGFEQGKAASTKTVPEQILRSPKPVVAAFIRALMDADGYAGDQGAILSTKSEDMSRLVQLLLMNFGILSRRRQQTDGCYHVHLTGASAKTFAEEIGFGYSEKAQRLGEYLDDLAWFEDEAWTDEIVEMESGSGDVYDISVRGTHRYAAGGVINHNSYWESLMMGEEALAGADEFVEYADHQSTVLGSGGLNPYKLGKELWEHVENRTNRREVVEKLLAVEGITPATLHDRVDFDAVEERLAPTPPLGAITEDTLADLRDLPPEKVDGEALQRALDGEIDATRQPWRVLTYEGLAERHFSLAKRRNRGFLGRIGADELAEIDRYLFEDDRYGSVEEALADVDHAAGWDRMRAVRESHNDVTFIDQFLTAEFVREREYFTYEYSHAGEEFRVASTDPADVKRKLLLQFTNFGKPTVVAADGNYRNRNELLLAHQYNGIMLDVDQARQVLERVFELWGRPVNLKTIVKELDEREREVARRRGEEPDVTEQGLLIRYGGEGFETEELDPDAVADIDATDVDYRTAPDDWL
jgi:spore cortex formation protein SpoVR/YcgB (stage V sporulation)/intein/homing endonuclease